MRQVKAYHHKQTIAKPAKLPMKQPKCFKKPHSREETIGTLEFWQYQQDTILHSNTETPSSITSFKTVYLIRHAQSQGQIANRAARKTDLSLTDCDITPLGVQQATQIPCLFTKEQLDSIELVVSSPLTRALHTAMLGFPNQNVLVGYALGEVSRNSIPENTARPIQDVLSDLSRDISKRDSSAIIDHTSLQPGVWPPKPPAVESGGGYQHEIEAATLLLQQLYQDRSETTMAIVCHYNVIRSLLAHHQGISIRPTNAIPIQCRLYANGKIEAAV